MATHKNLTDTKIGDLKIPATSYLLYRDRTDGLSVRVTEAGGRAFTLDFRTTRGRRRRMTLGDWNPPDFGIAAARAKAAALMAEIEAGADPMQKATDAAVDYKGRPTVARLADEWMRQHVIPNNRARTAMEYRALLNRYVLPVLGDRAVADVETSDVIDLVNGIRFDTDGQPRHGVTANRVRSILSAMFNHALATHQKNPWCSYNPVNKAVSRHREQGRERYLTADEYDRLMTVLRDSSLTAAKVLRLLVHTGARKGETLAATWSEFDLAAGVWVKPSHHTKQKRTHSVQLHPKALEVLWELNATRREGEELLFPSHNGQPIGTIKTAWGKLIKRAGIENFRIHDLRHTFASRLISKGSTLSEVGDLLGHTQASTTSRYAHLSKDAQRRTLDRLDG